MFSFPWKILVALALSGLLASCKLVVIVTDGGDVTSLTTTRDCAGGNVCEFEVADTTFTESFTAVAKPGYQFVRWRNGGSDFFCGDLVSPTCVLTNVPGAGIPVVEAVVDSFQLFHIMPVFEFVGIDTDMDGIPDHLDDDDDNDGLLDGVDPCPLNPDPLCTSAETIEQLVSNTCWIVSADVGNAAGQSFTPSVNGAITHIGMAIESDAANTNLIVIEGGIDGNVIYFQPVVTPDITGSPAAIVPYVLSIPVPVTSGQQYTVVVEDTGGFGTRFCGSNADPYAGGNAYQVQFFVPTSFPGDDAAFSVTIQ